MAFVRSLLVKLSLALAVPAAVAGWASATYFPYGDAARALVLVAIPLTLAVNVVASALALFAWAAPLVRAAAAPATVARQGAARAALRLPARVGCLVAFLTVAATIAVEGASLRVGLPLDVALAAGACGVGFAAMAGLLGHAVVAIAVAPVTAALGAFELRERGTVRAKVLLTCCGLLTSALLLVGGAGYARHRAETDRRYLATAASVQEHASRWIAERGAPQAAELVYVATGAPTAIVGRDGAIVARAGAADLSATAPPGAASDAGSGAVAAPGGWRLWRAAPGGLAVVSFLSDAPLRERRGAFWGDDLLLAAALIAALALVAWLAARSLTGPLALVGDAAGRIASGDLTSAPASVSRDEVGQLAADLRKVAQGITELVCDVQAASRGEHDGSRELGEIGERVKGGAREERARVVAVQAALEAMEGSVALVGGGVEGVADYVHATSAAVTAMAAALEDVRRKTQELEARSAATGADVDALSEAGRRAQAQLGLLDDLAVNARGTLAAVSASLDRLETSAVASQLAAAQAAELAEHAGGVVQETVVGIEGLHAAVDDAKKRVAALGRRSDDIDQILDFVGEVAQRTNLLSLNASIIATQAGEHGKAFAVVADQIRDLAAQISSSTKSIGEIIRAVRDDVSGTARLIDRGDVLAADGVARARRSLDALHAIRSATAKGHETAAAIRDAVQVHAHSTRDVSSLVASAGDRSQSLTDAVQLVGKSVAAVGSVSRAVGALADQVSRAIEDQSGVGRRQLDSLAHADAMLREITRAVEGHHAATRPLRDALAQIQRSAGQRESSVLELSAVAERIGGRSRALAERVAKYKIQLRG